MYKVLQRTLKRLNLPPVRLHALRAFFVATLLNGRVPPQVLRELLGHSDLATTQGTRPSLQAIGVLWWRPGTDPLPSPIQIHPTGARAAPARHDVDPPGGMLVGWPWDS
jgi:hypothetical protein